MRASCERKTERKSSISPHRQLHHRHNQTNQKDLPQRTKFHIYSNTHYGFKMQHMHPLVHNQRQVPMNRYLRNSTSDLILCLDFDYIIDSTVATDAFTINSIKL
uniref:Ovule protein n=1 Tax=Rhabditophanes sp. KR3021 TaxID=114890 RepID=A0AC35TZF5_9BILA